MGHPGVNDDSSTTSESTSCCPICLEPLASAPIGCVHPCGHVVHFACWESWANRVNNGQVGSTTRNARVTCVLCKCPAVSFCKIFLDLAAATAKRNDHDSNDEDDIDSLDDEDCDSYQLEALHAPDDECHVVTNDSNQIFLSSSAASATTTTTTDMDRGTARSTQRRRLQGSVVGNQPSMDDLHRNDDSSDDSSVVIVMENVTKKSRDGGNSETNASSKLKKYRTLAIRYKRRYRALSSQQQVYLQEQSSLRERLRTTTRELHETKEQIEQHKRDRQEMDRHFEMTTLQMISLQRANDTLKLRCEEHEANCRDTKQKLEHLEQSYQKELKAVRESNLAEVNKLLKQYPKLREQINVLREENRQKSERIRILEQFDNGSEGADTRGRPHSRLMSKASSKSTIKMLRLIDSNPSTQPNQKSRADFENDEIQRCLLKGSRVAVSAIASTAETAHRVPPLQTLNLTKIKTSRPINSTKPTLNAATQRNGRFTTTHTK